MPRQTDQTSSLRAERGPGQGSGRAKDEPEQVLPKLGGSGKGVQNWALCCTCDLVLRHKTGGWTSRVLLLILNLLIFLLLLLLRPAARDGVGRGSGADPSQPAASPVPALCPAGGRGGSTLLLLLPGQSETARASRQELRLMPGGPGEARNAATRAPPRPAGPVAQSGCRPARGLITMAGDEKYARPAPSRPGLTPDLTLDPDPGID
jgi:hypothetical protein